MNPDELKQLKEGLREILPYSLIGALLYLWLVAVVVLGIRFLINGTLP